MQGKGLIKLFLFLLIAVSLLQLFYMFPTRKVEKAAVEYADMKASQVGEDAQYVVRRTAKANYLDSLSGEEILKIPGLGSFSYEDLKSKQLALGLDLKGGMSSVLQVDLKDLLVRLSRNSRDPNFLAALDSAKEAQKSSQSDYITLFGQEYDKLEGTKKLANIFKRDASLAEQIDIDMDNGEIIRLLRTKADEMVQLTFGRLKQRINKLGIAQPNVSLDGARDLILVEMPGIENPERARNFLSASAALEFWDTYRNSDPGIMAAFTQADARLKAIGGEVKEETPAAMDTIWTPELDTLGNLTGDSTFTLQQTQTNQFANTGPLLSMLTLNNGSTDLGGYQTVMGFADKNKRKAVMAHLDKPEIKGLFPIDSKFMWAKKPFVDQDGETTKKYELYMIKKIPGSEKPPLEGDVITSASHGPNATGKYAVNLAMNNKGAQKWAEMTKKAFENGQREVAICIDNEVVSSPGVRNGAITGGRTEITGDFSVQEAADFAGILEVGKLPAKIRTIQEETVGPSLGAKNISSSIKALLFGFIMVLLFMIAYYAGGGLVSIIALLLNLFFIFGALASFGTVLTLPGIAGIILTIGMAVDANVIIYERIREELRAGKSNLAAINDGFKHSYSAIIDANVTTILVACILAYFGLGPIRGFAVVLIIGVLASLFTAVLIGRMIIDWWTKGDRNLSFWSGFSKNAFANLNIDWIGKRKVAYVISSVLIVAGLASIFTRGFDLGVDFKGGYSYNITFDQSDNVDAQKLRTGLADVFGGDEPIVKAVDSENTFNIVTSYLINDNSDDAPNLAMEALYNGVKAITGNEVTLEAFKSTDAPGLHVSSSSKVGPTIADDIKKSSFYAGIFALLLIFLYIFIRFNKWQYSLGAVAALFHDSLIVLGIFSLLNGIVPWSLEVNQAFIAAILTVIAYSINDTVVVFDRIREYLGVYSSKSTDEIINLAVNSTFSRTVITSLTTALMLIPLFLFGGGSIKGFAFAILIGIVVGTYSSVFVATPIVRDLSDDLKANNTKSTQSKSFSKAAAAAK